MTDSTRRQAAQAPPRPGKRERLVAAAVELIHEQGVESTTLADIAQRADVPAGNVYYYFKAKDDVVAAVVEAHTRQIENTLAAIDKRHRSPRARLKALVNQLGSQSDVVAQYGCPLGSLCAEVDKRSEAPQFATAQMMSRMVDWATTQFRELGQRPAVAHGQAIDLLAAYEGSALLANTLRDPAVLSDAAGRLARWIDTL